VVRRLRAATGSGKISFKNGAQQDASVPLSFKGFAQAFDALMKE
jgi:invasion protein IalB